MRSRLYSSKRSKKAQGLSLTTVVVAALALLVLIILSVIFVGRMARVSSSSKDCLKQGGTCYSLDDGAACPDFGEGLIEHPNAACQRQGADGNQVTDDTKICCIPAS
ncbi:hypothetical protein H6503_01735 [Candidatus Woesearchaeota archaeon]|nr:hypothetical protein [Candidatus Woesearchaeota archaeon]